MTTVKKKTEAVLPPHVVEKLLEEAGDKVVLVGGQALAFWANFFGIQWGKRMPFVSRDIDFLAPKASDFFEVKRFARILGGTSIFPSKHALTALIGQAVLDVSEDEYFNVDILHRVLSNTDNVRKRAISIEFHGRPCKVMHPLDVVASRLINLHKIPEKQNDLGVAQLEMSIDVARNYLRSLHQADKDVRPALRFLADLSKSDAGKKIAKRWGVHIADSIDPLVAIEDPNFRELHLPRLLESMSLGYKLELEQAALTRKIRHRP